jgi:hypothetical protein
MGAALQQRVDNVWQPLTFFPKKLNPAQQKYSAYDCELLAVYEAVKHFRHMLERATSPCSRTISPSLRLPAEAGQMLTTAVQPPRFRSLIHDRHTTHILTGQRRRRSVSRRIRL